MRCEDGVRIYSSTSCAIVSVFWLQPGNSFGCTVSKKNSYWASLMEKRFAIVVNVCIS